VVVCVVFQKKQPENALSEGKGQCNSKQQSLVLAQTTPNEFKKGKLKGWKDGM